MTIKSRDPTVISIAHKLVPSSQPDNQEVKFKRKLDYLTETFHEIDLSIFIKSLISVFGWISKMNPRKLIYILHSKKMHESHHSWHLVKTWANQRNGKILGYCKVVWFELVETKERMIVFVNCQSIIPQRQFIIKINKLISTLPILVSYSETEKSICLPLCCCKKVLLINPCNCVICCRRGSWHWENVGINHIMI